jgi:hypothetical protein
MEPDAEFLDKGRKYAELADKLAAQKAAGRLDADRLARYTKVLEGKLADVKAAHLRFLEHNITCAVEGHINLDTMPPSEMSPDLRYQLMNQLTAKKAELEAELADVRRIEGSEYAKLMRGKLNLGPK